MMLRTSLRYALYTFHISPRSISSFTYVDVVAILIVRFRGVINKLKSGFTSLKGNTNQMNSTQTQMALSFLKQ